jgi:hypothetical protein
MDRDHADRALVDPDQAEHVKWLERWAPKCPIGNPQRIRPCLAYREREPGRLQLRVALGPAEGVCDIVVDEQEDVVYVRALLCYDREEEDARSPDYWNCPVHVYLDRPLGDRGVFDIESDAFLPRYAPPAESGSAPTDDAGPAG